MNYINNKLPKLCFAKPGDVIRLQPEHLKEPDPTPYLVCIFINGKKRRAPLHASNGLYSEENPTFLVSLLSGECFAMPHLSSRVEIVKDIAIVESEPS